MENKNIKSKQKKSNIIKTLNDMSIESGFVVWWIWETNNNNKNFSIINFDTHKFQQQNIICFVKLSIWIWNAFYVESNVQNLVNQLYSSKNRIDFVTIMGQFAQPIETSIFRISYLQPHLPIQLIEKCCT